MQYFKEILMKKAKIIGYLKYPQRNNREAILKHLKSIKKQEKQNEQDENINLRSLSQLQFSQKQDLEKVYFVSFTVMKAFSKKFQFIPEDNEIYFNIVEMHHRFYVKQGAFQRAQQIKQSYRKKTVQKEIFLGTLLYWLYEFGKRKLDNFLNKNILSIEKDLLVDKLQSPKKLRQNVQNSQINTPANDLIFEGSIMNISYSQRLQKKDKKTDFKIMINGNESCNLFTQEQQKMKLNRFENQNEKVCEQQNYLLNSVSTRIETSFEPQKNDELSNRNSLLKQRSRSYNSDYQSKYQKYVNVSPNMNKQIFFGTYWKQMNNLYKNISCINDLDFYYLKTFKKQKQDRKEEVNPAKIQDLVESMIKNMPKIKKSIQNYSKEYSKCCPNSIKAFNSVSSKILLQQNKKKITKSLSNRKKTEHKYRQPQHNRVYEKMKSEQNNLEDQSPQKGTRNMALYRLRQRNKSLNDASLRKPTQEKQQMQMKLPIVYNSEHFNNITDSDAEKALAIHQKFDKFMVNGARPNKGLSRYKHLNKDRQKNFSEINEIIESRNNDLGSVFVDQRKDHEYEVANIRKILRKRQKQRLFVNRTPIIDSKKQDQMMDKIIMHIKAVQNQNSAQEKETKKTAKFDIFLNNLKNMSSSPFATKSMSKSINFSPMKSNQIIDYRSSFDKYRDDLLPKIT